MTTASNYIGGRITSTPEDQFCADGVDASVYKDDGAWTYYKFADGSRCKINADGEVLSVFVYPSTKQVSVDAKGGATICHAHQASTGRWTLVPGSVTGIKTHARAIINGLNNDTGAWIHGDEYHVHIRSI
jgi:hypothetical protein